jgi:8-hydroxy-5-deazaflavin:NADPH oxidoreductase
MDIGIIGAGHVGKALGASFVRAGHKVYMTARDLEEACMSAGQTGANALGSDREVAEAAEVVILAVPYTAVDEVLTQTGDALDGKIVVDATNPLTPDYSRLAVADTSEAEHIQHRVPSARVVKAFNAVMAVRQADPTVDGMPVDGFVAADDDEAKGEVLELERSIGMHPIDAGPLYMARSLEHLAFLNISVQMRSGGSWQAAWKLIEPGESRPHAA